MINNTRCLGFSSWKLTNPQNHNNDDFKYLVYAVSPKVRRELFKTMAEIHNVSSVDKSNYNVDETPFDNVDKFVHRQKICTSLIDPKHLATFAPVALIIDAPRDHILAASQSDMFSDFDIINLNKWRCAVPEDPETILKKSKQDRHNEVLL